MPRKDSQPVEITDDIFWIGIKDKYYGLFCNPYLIADGHESMVIDSGSRTEFTRIMLQFIKTGVQPSQVAYLVYQHFDPDVCSNVQHMAELIKRKDLKIISHSENNTFIHHLGIRQKLYCVSRDFSGSLVTPDRQYRFVVTPYAHVPGSFMTMDIPSACLFTSDLFGAWDKGQELIYDFDNGCPGCAKQSLKISKHNPDCPIRAMVDFNKSVMPSDKALQNALKLVIKQKPRLLCPQHGSLFLSDESINFAIQILMDLKGVGIDGLIA